MKLTTVSIKKLGEIFDPCWCLSELIQNIGDDMLRGQAEIMHKNAQATKYGMKIDGVDEVLHFYLANLAHAFKINQQLIEEIHKFEDISQLLKSEAFLAIEQNARMETIIKFKRESTNNSLYLYNYIKENIISDFESQKLDEHIYRHA